MQRNITQADLAEHAKISQMHVSFLERNIKSVTLRTAVAIADAFGELGNPVCIYELFKFECKEYDTCTRATKTGLNCYMDIEYKNEIEKNKI